MHSVGRNAGALVRLSVRLLLKHQLPTVTGVFWFSSQEKVLGAISSGMQNTSVARRARHGAAFLSEHTGYTTSTAAPLSRMLSWGVSWVWVYALKTFSQIITSRPLFFARKSLLINSCGAVHLHSTTLINRTQSAVSSPRLKALPWQYLASTQCFCAGKILRIYFQ